MNDFTPWLRGLAEKGGKGVVNNIDARCLGRIADELERLRSIAAERMDLFSQAASKVENAKGYVERAIASYVGDPADNEFQKGYLAALEAVRDETFDHVGSPRGQNG